MILDVFVWIFCCSVVVVFIMVCIRLVLFLVFGFSFSYTWGRFWFFVDDSDFSYLELILFSRLWRVFENLFRILFILNVNLLSVFILVLFKFLFWILFLFWVLFFGLGLVLLRLILENIEILIYLVYVYI